MHRPRQDRDLSASELSAVTHLRTIAACHVRPISSSRERVGRGMGRNKRSVWNVATSPFKEAHFATFPPALIEPCILAGCPEAGTVLDPFGGAGTTGLVADRKRRNAILIELNPEYAAIARRRIESEAGMLSDVRVESLTVPAPEAAAE